MRRRERLIIEHMPLVRRRAAILHRKLGGNLEEFEADGMVGLIEAAQRFKPSKNDNFPAYAIRRIDGAIRDAYRREDPLGRVGRERHQKGLDKDGVYPTYGRRVDLQNPEDWDALMAVAGDEVEELEKKYWKKILSILPLKLKVVMKMYYFEGKTDNEIGQILGGKTGSWVCQLRGEAISIIRKWLREKGLLDGS